MGMKKHDSLLVLIFLVSNALALHDKYWWRRVERRQEEQHQQRKSDKVHPLHDGAMIDDAQSKPPRVLIIGFGPR